MKIWICPRCGTVNTYDDTIPSILIMTKRRDFCSKCKLERPRH